MNSITVSGGSLKNKKRRYAIIPPGMDEWEACIAHLLNYTVPERCPRHQNFLRKYNVHMFAEGLKPASRYRELQIFSNFFAFLEAQGKNYKDFGYDDYLEFISFLEKNGVKRGLARVVVTVKKLVKYLGRKDLYEKIKTPKRVVEPPEILTKEEVYRLLEGIDDLEYRAMAAVMYECGLRLREVRMLKIKHVTPDEHGFTLRIEKSKSQWRVVRVIEFKDLLAKWLEVHSQRDNPDAWLFPSRWDHRRPVARNVLGVWLKKAVAKTGIRKRVYPHLLRHTRATELYQYFKEKEMMYLFGWKTRNMLGVYSYLKPEQIHEKYLALYGKIEERKETPEIKIIKCPRCGFENSHIAIFCARCGRPLKKEYIIEAEKESIEIGVLREELRELKKEFMKLLKQLGKS
ncbi:MAG: tyrosine-type recombinase/integrase [Thermoproteales archaeon]|nr:tyrosine-type recombinase/integrase [Thermoproteales archaeon]